MYTFTAKIYQLRPKIFPYLDTSTSTGSLHQKNDNIIFSSGSWHSKYYSAQKTDTGWLPQWWANLRSNLKLESQIFYFLSRFESIRIRNQNQIKCFF